MCACFVRGWSNKQWTALLCNSSGWTKPGWWRWNHQTCWRTRVCTGHCHHHTSKLALWHHSDQTGRTDIQYVMATRELWTFSGAGERRRSQSHHKAGTQANIPYPAGTRQWNNVEFWFRRWLNVYSTFIQHSVFAGLLLKSGDILVSICVQLIKVNSVQLTKVNKKLSVRSTYQRHRK
jgi:hypothetical protein